MSRTAVITLFAIAVFSQAAFAQFCNTPLSSVAELDLNRYSGRWYEIATSTFVRATFERDCVCTNANYTVTADSKGPYVEVRNECRKKTVDGELEIIFGRADQPNPSKPGELAVSFSSNPTTTPNYYIITYGPDRDYGYVLVGEPCRLALWILARTPSLSPEIYNELVTVAERNGFNTRLIGFAPTTQQGCYGNERCQKTVDLRL